MNHRPLDPQSSSYRSFPPISQTFHVLFTVLNFNDLETESDFFARCVSVKNTPIIIHVTTLSDLATQREAGLVRGLYASCDNQHCHRVYTPIDLDAMILEYGGACDWKTLKPVCVECDKLQRDYRAASLHIDWCDTSQVKGYRLEGH